MVRKELAVFASFVALSMWACDEGGKTRSVDYTEMACTEIMYHGADSLEFIELKATGTPLTSMLEASLRLDGAVYYAFPDEPLDTSEYIVVTNDTTLFRTKYPDFTGRLFGPWLEEEGSSVVGNLSNSGDVVEVKLNGQGDADCRFDDNPPWPKKADGGGSSLVFIGENPAYAESWAASTTVGGNPGSATDPVYKTPAVRINEIMPYGNSDTAWIEFYNAGSENVDISGWKLVRADATDSVRYLPEGSIVPAGSFLVVTTDEVTDGLFFTARGEDVYLREVNAAGELTGSETGLEYPSVPTGKTAGVTELSDGYLAQGALATVTKNAENASLLMGPLYISEAYYNPPDGDVEFLELVNKSTNSVTLQGIINGELAGWKVEGIGLTFSKTITIAPDGIILLLPTNYIATTGATVTLDAAWYREQVGLASSVSIVQYSGKLSNRGESIVVMNPIEYTEDASEINGLKWYYQWSDALLYSDGGAWPSEADGEGKSLTRSDFTVSGYEPSAWIAANPTPGRL